MSEESIIVKVGDVDVVWTFDEESSDCTHHASATVSDACHSVEATLDLRANAREGVSWRLSITGQQPSQKTSGTDPIHRGSFSKVMRDISAKVVRECSKELKAQQAETSRMLKERTAQLDRAAQVTAALRELASEDEDSA